MLLRLNEIIWESKANGPGIRTVLFFQGCKFNCDNCVNPQTHDPNGGFEMPIEVLVKEIKSRKKDIEGITISGGEPFLQPKQLYSFLIAIKELNLGVIISTGYKYEELIQEVVLSREILEHVDLVIPGRFHHNLEISKGYRGSHNKKYIFLSQRYSREEMENVPQMEIIFSGNEIKATGIKLNKFFPWSAFKNEK
jgi:anaerobic ribonucleoside-triphosphate reductase activating protein